MPDGFVVAKAFVTVDPDAAGFDEKLKAQLGGVKAKVGADTAEADAKLDDTKAKLTELDHTTANRRSTRPPRRTPAGG